MINDKAVGTDKLFRKNNLLIDIELLHKEEIAQRRKLRIQQVRLQSKDIANKVLQDVRNERTRQLQAIKNKRCDLFNKWQARKLDEINLKYKENISRLGSGYRAAEAQPDPEKEILDKSKKNSDIAQIRGKKAFDHLRNEQEILRKPKEKNIGEREKVKNIEGLRSALVSSLPPPNTKRKSLPKITEENLTSASNGSENEPRNNPRDFSEQCLENNPVSFSIKFTKNERSSDLRNEKKCFPTSSKMLLHPNNQMMDHVETYDRRNPCTFTQRQPLSVRVERTSPESQTNAREAAEKEEKFDVERQMKKENEEVIQQRRGKKALAKEMIRRDFDRLVNRLDGLAREEHLARGSLPPSMPVEMFMDEKRSAQRALKLQRNMDSVFEGLFHGNEDVAMKEICGEDAEDNNILPPVVEQVELPEKWQENVCKSIVSPPQKLNVGAYDLEMDSFSALEHVAKGSLNISYPHNKQTKDWADRFQNSESTAKSDDILSEHDQASILLEEESDEEGDISLPLVCRGDDQVQTNSFIQGEGHVCPAKPVEKLEDGERQKESDEVSSSGPESFPTFEKVTTATQTVTAPLCKHDKGECTDHLSSDEMEPGEVKKAESSTQTFDIISHQKIHPFSEAHRKDVSCLTSEPNDISTSSKSLSSVNIEEVCVVFKFDEETSQETSVEEEVSLPCAPAQKQKKRTTPPREQTKMKEHAVVGLPSMVRDVDSPDIILPSLKEEKVKGSEMPIDAVEKQSLKKKKSDKTEKQKNKGSIPLVKSDSSYLSPPDHQEISGSEKMEALLQEIRSQRKQLEKWVSSQRPKDIIAKDQLSHYVCKLLHMSRESVAELSVSDVSTPSIHLSPRASVPVVPAVASVPVVPDKRVARRLNKPHDKKQSTSQPKRKSKDKSLDSDRKGKNQTVVPLTYRVKSPDEEVSPPKLKETKTDSPHQEKTKSPSVIRNSTLPLLESSTSTSLLSVTSSYVEDSSEHKSYIPVQPPPSPEYDQLSDMHSHRISQLGAKLLEIRQTQKKLLSLSSSSGTDIQKSSSDVTSSDSIKIYSSSSERSSSVKSDDSAPKENVVHTKNWDLLDISLSTIEDSEDIPSLEDILLKPQHGSKPEQIFKNMPETAKVKPAKVKSHPPPTPMKGLRWSAFDYQIPHELSTIAEVDSKLISTTSILEPIKEKDLSASDSNTPLKLAADSVLISRYPEFPQPEKTAVQSPLRASDSFNIIKSKLPRTNSPVEKESLKIIDIKEQIHHHTKNVIDITSEDLPEKILSSREVLSDSGSSSTSLIDDASYSSQYPGNLDDALRLLGISPTMFKHPDSPTSADLKTSEHACVDSTGETAQSNIRGSASSMAHSIVKEIENFESVIDIGLHDQAMTSFERKDIGFSISTRKSSLGSKERQTPVPVLLHSTPVQSISIGTSSSSSDSAHKNSSGFPFLGDSAPSSISGGTPMGIADWRNIDDTLIPEKSRET